ncbi:hypothetical protein C1H46_005911 [Malus baccata]|uniref:Uncharacterized protein n=1 Tax=Malus baccata TaxID=106549 RepID=A0A540NBL0_MALBA|nr:hypothetical protein C1H46_005911 [Malus baccata]
MVRLSEPPIDMQRRRSERLAAIDAANNNVSEGSSASSVEENGGHPISAASLECAFRAQKTQPKLLSVRTMSKRLIDKENLEKRREDLGEMIQNASAEVAKAQGKVNRLTEKLESDKIKNLKRKLKEEKEEKRKMKEDYEFLIAEQKSLLESVKRFVKNLEGALKAELEEVKNLKKDKMEMIKEIQELKDQLNEGSPCAALQDIQIEKSGIGTIIAFFVHIFMSWVPPVTPTVFLRRLRLGSGPPVQFPSMKMVAETRRTILSNDHEGEAEAENRNVSELVSALRAASRAEDFARIEEALAGREAELKREIERQRHEKALMEEKHEFERLEKLKAEDELRVKLSVMVKAEAVSEDKFPVKDQSNEVISGKRRNMQRRRSKPLAAISNNCEVGSASSVERNGGLPIAGNLD